MKKILLIFLVLLLVGCTPEKFQLDEEIYEHANLKEINKEEFLELENSKKSFILFVYMPNCSASKAFNEVIKEFVVDNGMTIYKISWLELDNTSVKKYLKYYPSAILFNKGKMVDYLEADSNEDLEYYKTASNFKKWLDLYLNHQVEYKEINDNSKSEIKESSFYYEISKENIKREKGKTNIYLFYGQGCPHCEAFFSFLENIKFEYGNYFDLYAYEVFYNEDNLKVLEELTKITDVTYQGVPYIIIGDQVHNGYKSSDDEEIKKLILDAKEKEFDIFLNNK